jgi:FSR family fosmidomycin resistance protein-like MFS transporter
MNKQAIALLSLGHFLIDLCQGIAPTLVAVLVTQRNYSYAKSASLVFAISATSSVIQPLFGQLADRLAISWLLPVSILLAGASLTVGAQAANYWVVWVAFGLSGLGVAAFHPEAARKAHLASGDRRSTGMSFFSVGGGLGFALAPVITIAVIEAWGIRGLLAFLLPTGIIAALVAVSLVRETEPSHSHHARNPIVSGDDDWRAFGILSCATVCRSIVFYGLNTLLALYFMTRWDQSLEEGNRALAVFLGTSIFGTLTGGWLADRFGRREVIRTGFAGAAVFMTMLVCTSDPLVALLLLVPLSVFIFMPTSVLVVLGQEYLPRRVGMAAGVTLGLAVSVGGMCAPLLGWLGARQGLITVLFVLLALLAAATAQTFALPPAGRRIPLESASATLTAGVDRSS